MSFLICNLNKRPMSAETSIIYQLFASSYLSAESRDALLKTKMS